MGRGLWKNGCGNCEGDCGKRNARTGLWGKACGKGTVRKGIWEGDCGKREAGMEGMKRPVGDTYFGIRSTVVLPQ